MHIDYLAIMHQCAAQNAFSMVLMNDYCSPCRVAEAKCYGLDLGNAAVSTMTHSIQLLFTSQ